MSVADEDARRAIGRALLDAFAARGELPRDLADLIGAIDAQPKPTPAPRRRWFQRSK